jgi:hypothetical protein
VEEEGMGDMSERFSSSGEVRIENPNFYSCYTPC